MSIRVMSVDDSSIVRTLIANNLSNVTGIEVVAKAANGQEAVDLAKEHQPDVVVLDIEMPVMDGITAIPHLLEISPDIQIIMLSRLTAQNAKVSMEALQKGAVDCVQKPDSNTNIDDFFAELSAKIKAVAGPKVVATKPRPSAAAKPVAKPSPAPLVKSDFGKPKAVAIASSTGGPQALQRIFEGLKGFDLKVPVFITQHMPPIFTAALAETLAKVSGYECAEAGDCEVIAPGRVYIAPGGYHMLVKRDGTNLITVLSEDEPVNFCRPAADPMLDSLAQIYGKHLLFTILTGMGQDGMNGAKSVLDAKGLVIAQNEESCTVYGMPKAVVDAGYANEILALGDIADRIKKSLG